MKKRSILLSLALVCCAIIIALGSAWSMLAAGYALKAQASSNDAPDLFNNNGEYAISKTQMVKGAKFKFFGYTWRVVNFNTNGDIVTFWMDSPMSTHNFCDVTAHTNQGADNTYTNGYTLSTWTGNTNGVESSIRQYLEDQAAIIIDNQLYAAYKDKVMPGYQAGSNYFSDEVTISKVYYCEEAGRGKLAANVTMTSQYNLSTDGVHDRLWLPAREEVNNGGMWGLTNNDRNWDDHDISNLAWLRTPSVDKPNFVANSTLCTAVGYSTSVHIYGRESALESPYSIYNISVTQVDASNNPAIGVRPAIHMNVASADQKVVKDKDSGWFTDDMMKVFFIVICVLGVVGVVLIVVAIIRKARANRA